MSKIEVGEMNAQTARAEAEKELAEERNKDVNATLKAKPRTIQQATDVLRNSEADLEVLMAELQE